MENRWFYPLFVLFLGLFAAQTISTVQVYLSNVELYHTLVNVKDAGYLPIPNERTMPHLQQFWPAFFGGLFFTLTVGAGLSLLAFSSAWSWERFFRRENAFIILFLLPFLGFLVAANYQGLSPMVTLYFLLIPLIVFIITLKYMPPRPKKRVWLNRTIHAAPLILLSILWTSQKDDQLFLNLRDRLLLSNSFGMKVADFYYDYTCYPTNVFETLNQKSIKICNLGDIQKRSVSDALEKKLLNHDYLNIDSAEIPDLKVTEEETSLVFENKGKAILRTDLKSFLSNPGRVLREFSSKTDSYSFFRQFTFFSLLIGFPVILYILLYHLFRSLFGLILHSKTASVTASVLCFITGSSLLVIFSLSEGSPVVKRNLENALHSAHLEDRIAALKIIEQKGLEIADYQNYRHLMNSPHVSERYWLVNALMVSRHYETLKDLMAFLDDPHSNVVSRAFYALGQRGEKGVIHEMLQRMEASTDWRNQRYAYIALRALGWKQNRSE
jgi:Ca2+/Na+ antiporter